MDKLKITIGSAKKITKYLDKTIKGVLSKFAETIQILKNKRLN